MALRREQRECRAQPLHRLNIRMVNSYIHVNAVKMSSSRTLGGVNSSATPGLLGRDNNLSIFGY